MKKRPTAPPVPVVDIRNLRIERDAVILDHVDWTVLPGEHWVVLGANGSGKTSLLSALTGYLSPSSGQISVLGREYGHFDWRELRKAVGLVSSSIRQRIEEREIALETVVSGKTAMLNHWGRITKKDRDRANSILWQLDCAALAKREWRFLSQGERQRVLIGRALMADLKLLILDEPCAGLDPVAREQFLSFIQRLMRNLKGGPTLILVTHHVEEIIIDFTHAILLKKGTSIATGKISSVLTSQALSEVFETPLTLSKRKGSYSLIFKFAKKPSKLFRAFL